MVTLIIHTVLCSIHVFTVACLHLMWNVRVYTIDAFLPIDIFCAIVMKEGRTMEHHSAVDKSSLGTTNTYGSEQKKVNVS